jgi:hypothetical protein
LQNDTRPPSAARLREPLQSRDQRLLCRGDTELCRTGMDSLMRGRERPAM